MSISLLLLFFLIGLFPDLDSCRATDGRATSLSNFTGHLFSSKFYPDIERMISTIQKTDLDRVDWVSPEDLLRLRRSPDQLNELSAVLKNIKFFTDTLNKMGPWTVTKKDSRIVPDGDVHQYVSWARYFWPVGCASQSMTTNMQKRRLKQDESATSGKSEKEIANTTLTSNLSPEQDKKSNGIIDNSGNLSESTLDKKKNGTSSNPFNGAAKGGKSAALAAKSDRKKIPILAKVQANRTSVAVVPEQKQVSSGDKSPSTTKLNATESVSSTPTFEQTFPEYCSHPDNVEDKTLIWKNCPYENRDGKSNPDIDLIKDSVAFRSACRAAFLNAVYFGLTGRMEYGRHASSIIRTFFLNPQTAMRPEMKYGQIIRGPARNGSDNDWTIGTFRGLIDSRHLIKAWNAVIIMRSTHCSSWTLKDDLEMNKWTEEFSSWLLNDLKVSLTARNKMNNIKSWWYSQAIASNILIGNKDMTNRLIDKYFLEEFIGLIDANGDQPNETNRTRPAHYRAFGLETMILNARLASFVGKNEWFAKSNVSTTMNDAVQFGLKIATENSKQEEKAELAPHIATALVVYGDTNDQSYQRYLDNNEAYGDVEKNATWRLFDRPDMFQRTSYSE